jgi:glycolate oxidase iron-sulfur subunit
MQTRIAAAFKHTPEGEEADAILLKCVHCGFCNATCPTYQLLGDELDGPRGRIYLIKQVLEGAPPTRKTQLHLDRCLTCRACETTCPSGVQYGHLADIGRAAVEARVPRTFSERTRRAALRTALPRPRLFAALLGFGRMVAPLLPASLRAHIPPSPQEKPAWAPVRHARRMLILDGCVQPALAPSINAAASRVLDRVGISLQRAPGAGCCGAIDFHLNAVETARSRMRALIDAWWPAIESGAEAIVFTASGCGAMLQDYEHVLQADASYRAKAQKIVTLAKDLSEVLQAERERLHALAGKRPAHRIAFHAPCTLQHALRLQGTVETLLGDLGFTLAHVPDSHLCCGSAGTYSILQPELSKRLKSAKQAALQSEQPQEIVTANIGCLMHLQSGMNTPIRHWIELVDEVLEGAANGH